VNETRGEAFAVPGMNSFLYRATNASPLLLLSIKELHEFLTVEGKILNQKYTFL